MAKTVEFEKTYLLRYVPPPILQESGRTEFLRNSVAGMKGCDSVKIADIYIPATAAHPIIRIRKMGDKLELTKKQPVAGNDSSEQSEQTIELTKEEFAAFRAVPGKELVKTRYFMGNAQIDVFHGRLEGLVTADFEFKSRQEMEAFRHPVFCLADVTQEKAFAGGMLCGKSYRGIEPVLQRFGYKKIIFTPRSPSARV